MKKRNFPLKSMLMLAIASFVLSAFVSCDNNEDAKVTYKRVYEMALNGGQYGSTSSEYQWTDALSSAYSNALSEEQQKLYGKTGFYQIEIEGEGATEEEAKAAAHQKAKDLYNSKLEAAKTAMQTIKTKFDAKRTDLATEIAATPSDIFLKYNLIFFIQKAPASLTSSDEDWETIATTSENPVVLEAIGGTNY